MSATTSTTATSTTVSTQTLTVVGTTPAALTVTQTTVHVSTTPPGPGGIAVETGTPLPAPGAAIQGQTIDGILCQRINQLAHEAYAHLQIYAHGRAQVLPGAIGLVQPSPGVSGTVTTYSQGLCAYWLRTTSTNGVIQIRSPVARRFTLGQLFDIWGEPLSRHDVAGLRGTVSARVNGRRWRTDPRDIPLREHEAIELAVGRPVPRFMPVNWSNTDL